jgi:hypothetical protein
MHIHREIRHLPGEMHHIPQEMLYIPHLHLSSPNNKSEGEDVHRGYISLLRVKAFLYTQRASISSEGDIV